MSRCECKPEVERAKELLRSILPEGQWAQFSKTGVLEVSGSRGTYCICADDVTCVVDAQTRRPFARACMQLSVAAPVYDRIIAEYVLIRNDEDFYWHTANIFPAGWDNRTFAIFLAALFDVMLFVTLVVQLSR